jgi:tetratricopeptide (TPR) repeat protein
MTCDEVDERGLAEEYLGGRLTDEERDAFERHFFDCDRCFREVEALRAIRGALLSAPVTDNRAPAMHLRTWLPMAAAVLLAATAATWWVAGRGAQQRPAPADRPARIESASPAPGGTRSAGTREAAIQQLAKFEPPRLSTRLRNGPAGAFQQALEQYRSGNYVRAVPLFESALRDDPSSDQIRFYLGASALMAEQADTGVAALSPVAADRNSPYAEEAQYLLAKAHLQRNDLDAAAAALDRTVAFGGDRLEDARRLRTEIEKLR